MFKYSARLDPAIENNISIYYDYLFKKDNGMRVDSNDEALAIFALNQAGKYRNKLFKKNRLPLEKSISKELFEKFRALRQKFSSDEYEVYLRYARDSSKFVVASKTFSDLVKKETGDFFESLWEANYVEELLQNLNESSMKNILNYSKEVSKEFYSFLESKFPDVPAILRDKHYFKMRSAEIGVSIPLEKIVDLLASPLNVRIRVDSEVRKGKLSGAGCYPVRVPGDIRLRINPKGESDLTALFMVAHETGHAILYSIFDEKTSAVYKRYAPTHVKEGVAFLYQNLFQNDYFLSELGIESETEKFKEYAQVTLNSVLVNYARYFRLENEVHRKHLDMKSADALWKKFLQEDGLYCTGLEGSWRNNRTIVTRPFYSVNYLRAFEVYKRFESNLIENFGENWYKQKDALSALRDLVIEETDTILKTGD